METQLSIYALCDLIETDILISRYANQNGRWIAKLDGWQIRENESIVSGFFGSGDSPQKAIECLVAEMRGKKIETKNRENRRSFKIPETLTV